MGRRRATAGVIASVLVVLLAGCAQELVDADDCPPSCPGDTQMEESEEEERPTLGRDQMERYYGAQIAWRDCAIGEGLDLPEPPALEEFAAEDGAWSVGADVSDDEWNRLIVGDGPGEGGVGRACGEPPVPHDFLIGREALERLYAWHVQVLACLESEGFPVDTTPPPVEEFLENNGLSWSPAREFHSRYGFPSGPAWTRVATRCGNPEQDLWLQASDFDVDRAELQARYEELVALTACLEGAGFTVQDPPPLEEFIEEIGWNWTHAGIWGAAYRDNDRRALQRFADRIDQACPDAA